MRDLTKKLALSLWSMGILMLLIFIACQKEVQSSVAMPKPMTNQEKVESTKQWFEHYQNSDAVESISKFKNAQPQWLSAISVGNIVEVPITIDGQYNVPSLYNNSKHLGEQRLVIYNQPNKGRQAYIVDYMPTNSYTENLKNVNLTNFRYKKFDGIIAVFSLNDKSIAGCHYDKGLLAKVLKIKQKESSFQQAEECYFTTFEYACGSVSIGDQDGDRQCSIGYRLVCWGIDSNNEEDAANCADSPWLPMCTNGGGFDSGGGEDTGCTDPDPCVCNPDGPDCGCKCLNNTQTRYFIGESFFSEGPITIGSVKFNVNFNVVDCSKPIYSTTVIPITWNPFGAMMVPYPGSQSTNEEYLHYKNSSNCGWTVGREISGMWQCTIKKIVTYNGSTLNLDLNQTQTYWGVTGAVTLN